MTKMLKIASKTEIPSGKMKEFKINNKIVTIANVQGQFFAFDGLCTHAHCSLAGGLLENGKIICYCHGAQFDIKTGKVLAGPATAPLKIYKLEVKGEEMLIEI